MFFKKNKFLIILLLVGAFLRFYKLDWGQGLFTHPDEYHIVASVNQLTFPSQMNPHFFSYGTVIIYLIYFTQEILKHFLALFSQQPISLNLFLIGRFYSALFSTFTIYCVYRICKLFMSKYFSYLAALLVAITPGIIQQAHFATPESALTFFLFVSLFFVLKFIQQNKIIFLVTSSIFLGLAMGVKISSAVFLLPLTISAIINSWPKKNFFKKPILFIKQIFKKLPRLTGSLLIIFIVTTGFFALGAPFVFIDFPAFQGNVEYEGGLAAGKFSVFYTHQFINTIPVLFQFEKILPYVLGPFLLLFSLFGFIVLAINTIKNGKSNQAIICIAFLSTFITNAFLFAKWTRFIAPAFPFFAIFAGFLLEKIYLKNKFVSKLFTLILLTGSLLWTIAFFSIYLHPDIRATASDWVEKNLPKKSTILVEGGNMIDIPLKGDFQRISLDFYSLEDNQTTRTKIANTLYSSTYFFVQSRRVFYNHQRLPALFPKTANFYNALFNKKLGFTQMKEFHSYPGMQIGNLKLEIPDEKAEETWSVFDHPVIRIFEKTKQLSIEDYERILENK
jgi:4-amino-4-deoxy-L-arabinose transferase-like glycosyltransferase